jgi:hypothetical protein
MPPGRGFSVHGSKFLWTNDMPSLFTTPTLLQQMVYAMQIS